MILVTFFLMIFIVLNCVPVGAIGTDHCNFGLTLLVIPHELVDSLNKGFNSLGRRTSVSKVGFDLLVPDAMLLHCFLGTPWR